MKSLLNTIIFLLLLLGQEGCVKNYKMHNPTKITFNVDDFDKYLNLSEISDTINYLPLETNSMSYIGFIQKMRVSKDNYFFLTGFNTEKIFSFNKASGEFNYVIDNNGKGPGEYVRATEIMTNYTDNSCDIYSNGKLSILKFDSIGNFINEFKLKSYPANIIKYNNQYLLNSYIKSQREKTSLMTLSQDGKILSKGILIDNYGYGEDNSFNFFGDSLSFGHSIDRNIYHLIDNNFVAKYCLDFKKYNFPEEKLIRNNHGEIINKKIMEDYMVNMWNFFESSKFIVSTVFYRSKGYLAIYCKKTGHTKLIDGFIDDFSRGDFKYDVDRKFLPKALDTDTLVFAIEPTFLKQKYLASGKENSDSLTEIAKSYKEFDNPILLKIILKNF